MTDSACDVDVHFESCTLHFAFSVIGHRSSVIGQDITERTYRATMEVLVLNSDFEPLNVCHVRRALVMVYLGKADVLHAHESSIPINYNGLAHPSVVKLRHHVRRPLPELKLSRRTVFARDQYVCQYCGHTGKDLTIDHVVPKRHGGAT